MSNKASIRLKIALLARGCRLFARLPGGHGQPTHPACYRGGLSRTCYLNPSLQLSDFAVPLRLPFRVGLRIRQFLKAVAPGKRVLAVHSETKRHKRWAPDRQSKVLVAFLERHPEFVIFVLDFYKPKLKMTKFKDRIIHSRGLPLLYAFGALKKSDLFLGVDSCMLHAADLFRIPGVGLFGPTDPRRYGFLFAPHRHVHDSRGMKFISESSVLKALESLLV